MIPTLIDATLSDPRVSIGAIVLAALSTGGLLVREWIRKAKHAANNKRMIEQSDREADAAEAVAREQGAAAVVPELLGEIRGYRAEIGGLRAEMDRKLRESDERCAELRRDDHEKCQGQIAAVRDDLGTVAAIARESLRPEDTGLHRTLDRIVRKSPTPAEPMHAIPPPPRGKETP